MSDLDGQEREALNAACTEYGGRVRDGRATGGVYAFMWNAARDFYGPLSLEERCNLCGEFFPKPVELHHAEADCLLNLRALRLAERDPDNPGSLAFQVRELAARGDTERPERELYLARREPPSMGLNVIDGAHSDEEGVATAVKLHCRIFSPKAGEGPAVMVEVFPVPDLDPPINEDAADACREMLRDTERPDDWHVEALRLLKALLGYSAAAPITRASIATLDEARAFVRDTEQEPER